MTQAAHTPGRLHISELNAGGFFATDGSVAILNDEKRVFQVDCQSRFKRGEGHAAICAERDANAQRLVDCWNALEGIPDPSVVGEAIEALRHLTAHVAAAKMAFPDNPVQAGAVVRGSLSFCEFERAASILAKLEGGA